MHSVRQAAVAGSFYPADKNQLDKNIEYYLENCHQPEIGEAKAFIVPHAGIRFSGMIAASVYASIAKSTLTFKQVVLLGPSHHVWFKGMAIPSVDSFVSPLGEIPLQKATLNELLQFPEIQVADEAHQQEHCLEVQLPFLQKVLHDFSLIPIVVGETNYENVAQIIDYLWTLENTLFLISSDLSHFHDYETANQIDQETTLKIIAKDYQSIAPQMACGCIPIQGMLSVAQSKMLSVFCIGQCNSGDTAGDKSRVVGYAAYAIG